jgi:hypothetical protein
MSCDVVLAELSDKYKREGWKFCYMIKADDGEGHTDKATEEILETPPVFEAVFAHFLFFTKIKHVLKLFCFAKTFTKKPVSFGKAFFLKERCFSNEHDRMER